jgi:hypothetical protein
MWMALKCELSPLFNMPLYMEERDIVLSSVCSYTLNTISFVESSAYLHEKYLKDLEMVANYNCCVYFRIDC